MIEEKSPKSTSFYESIEAKFACICFDLRKKESKIVCNSSGQLIDMMEKGEWKEKLRVNKSDYSLYDYYESNDYNEFYKEAVIKFINYRLKKEGIFSVNFI